MHVTHPSLLAELLRLIMAGVRILNVSLNQHHHLRTGSLVMSLLIMHDKLGCAWLIDVPTAKDVLLKHETIRYKLLLTIARLRHHETFSRTTFEHLLMYAYSAVLIATTKKEIRS